MLADRETIDASTAREFGLINRIMPTPIISVQVVINTPQSCCPNHL